MFCSQTYKICAKVKQIVSKHATAKITLIFHKHVNWKLLTFNRPVTSLGHHGDEEFSGSGPNFLNYVQ